MKGTFGDIIPEDRYGYVYPQGYGFSVFSNIKITSQLLSQLMGSVCSFLLDMPALPLHIRLKILQRCGYEDPPTLWNLQVFKRALSFLEFDLLSSYMGIHFSSMERLFGSNLWTFASLFVHIEFFGI